jgi:phage-related protein
MFGLLPVRFWGDSREALRGFPELARRRAGRQLQLVQRGLEPTDWKPMQSVGAGVREIRIRDESSAYRVIYVTKIAGRVFVLHCFQKNTQKTSAADLELAKRRYRELQKEYSR